MIFYRLKTVLALTLLALTGCGAGADHEIIPPRQPNNLAITLDTYGLQQPVYFSASTLGATTVLRAAIAASAVDPNFSTILRLDLDRASIAGPGQYRLSGAQGDSASAGAVYVVNGHSSTLLKTTSGVLTLSKWSTTPGGEIAGVFQIKIQDGADTASYDIGGSFAFYGDSADRALNAPDTMTTAAALFAARCGDCHQQKTALALAGGRFGQIMINSDGCHKGACLDPETGHLMQVLLNSW